MERINRELLGTIIEKESVNLARWESIGEVTENHYTTPFYGEFVAGTPVCDSGDHYSKNPNGVQAVASVKYVKGIGYIVSVNTLDASICGTLWEHFILKPAKRFNKAAAKKVVSDFGKIAESVITEKKKEDGITAPGTVKFIDELAEQEAAKKEMWGK